MFPFPRIKTDNTPSQQLDKVKEELGELIHELDKEHLKTLATTELGHGRRDDLTAEEYWDVVQAVSTLGYLLEDQLGAVTMTKARLNVIQRCKDRGYYE